MTAAYAYTILTAEPGRRLAKLYTCADAPPDDYDAGMCFQAEERNGTFAEFVETLENLGPDQCLIRGAVREDAREAVSRGELVWRRAYERDGVPPAFDGASRNWIVLDFDETSTRFDPLRPAESIATWRATLPPEIRDAESAFFLSASAHRSPTVRGKLLVALRAPLDDASAAAYARSLGADGSVCYAVQPNYFAAPVFAQQDDPLAGHRAPIRFRGRLARLPQISREQREQNLGDREATPDDLPELSLRAFALAETIRARWADGGRIETHAWLHLCGWCLGKGWTKGELGAMLVDLDSREPSVAKRNEHWHILGNARAIEGPGGAREWLGDAFDGAHAAVEYSRPTAAFSERRLARNAERFASATEQAQQELDAWCTFESFTSPEREVPYLCRGLCLAPSKGKVSIVAGNAGGGKGPIADHLAVAFALGAQAFEAFDCAPTRVLLIDVEGPLLTQRRLRRMARAMGYDHQALEGRIFHKDATAIGDILSPENQEGIAAAVARFGIGVVVVDSYTSAMLASGIDANTPQYAQLAQMLGRLDVLALCVGHANKASAKMGEPSLADLAYSQAFGAMAQTAIVAHYPDPHDRHVVRVGCARAPEVAFASFDARFDDVDCDGESGLRLHLIEASSATPPPEIRRLRAKLADAGTNADRVVALLASDVHGAGMQPRKLRDALGMSAREWAACYDELLRRGEVIAGGTPNERHITVRLTART